MSDSNVLQVISNQRVFIVLIQCNDYALDNEGDWHMSVICTELKIAKEMVERNFGNMSEDGKYDAAYIRIYETNTTRQKSHIPPYTHEDGPWYYQWQNGKYESVERIHRPWDVMYEDDPEL